MIAVKILGVFLLVQVAQAITANYCDPKLCKNGNGTSSPHIGCNNTGWSAICGVTKALVPVTDDLKKIFLDVHNERRNFVASGKAPNFAPAVRMATMVWSSELASLAELNTKQCVKNHEPCHNTDTFKYSGQNLMISDSYQNYTAIEAQVNGTCYSWFSEIKNTNQRDIDSFPESTRMIGHFTAMVAAHSTHMGCGISRHTESGGWKKTLIACNYAAPNGVGRSIYVKGPAASKCKATNPKYTSLCAVGENIDPNAFDKAP